MIIMSKWRLHEPTGVGRGSLTPVVGRSRPTRHSLSVVGALPRQINISARTLAPSLHINIPIRIPVIHVRNIVMNHRSTNLLSYQFVVATTRLRRQHKPLQSFLQAALEKLRSVGSHRIYLRRKRCTQTLELP